MDSGGSGIPSEALKKKRKSNDPQTMSFQIVIEDYMIIFLIIILF